MLIEFNECIKPAKPRRLDSLPVGVYRAVKCNCKIVVITTRFVDQHMIFVEHATTPELVEGNYTVHNPVQVTIESIYTKDVG